MWNSGFISANCWVTRIVKYVLWPVVAGVVIQFQSVVVFENSLSDRFRGGGTTPRWFIGKDSLRGLLAFLDALSSKKRDFVTLRRSGSENTGVRADSIQVYCAKLGRTMGLPAKPDQAFKYCCRTSL